MRSGLTVALLLGIAIPGRSADPTSADAQAPPAAAEEAGWDQWQLESLKLRDDTVYQGLVLGSNQEEIEFAEIVRPPGRPMFSVIRPVDPDQVAALVRLPAPRRQKLFALFQQFRTRARIEAGRMQDVQLQPGPVDGGDGWVYQGVWFRLEATTDEEMTRRAVVRIEQIFRAYRQVLRPVAEPGRQLRVLLFGDMDGYRGFVERSSYQVDNPAFYAPADNLIVAGSDLNAYSRQMARVRTHHAEVRRQYQLLDSTFAARLAAVLEELRQNGYDAAEVEQEARLRRTVWQRERDMALSRIEVAERQNEARFAELTQRMFARLYHEAFHAYVDNCVFPEPSRNMPRWLNEGLAQIFETAQLDADTLRIDAPDPLRLGYLRQDLAGDGRLSIAQVLAAADDDFLDGHGPDAVRQLYVYAWGLAYYLTYEQNLFQGRKLEEYVANPGGFGPAARLARLTGIPLPKFEAAWRTAMLALKPL